MNPEWVLFLDTCQECNKLVAGVIGIQCTWLCSYVMPMAGVNYQSFYDVFMYFHTISLKSCITFMYVHMPIWLDTINYMYFLKTPLYIIENIPDKNPISRSNIYIQICHLWSIGSQHQYIRKYNQKKGKWEQKQQICDAFKK